MWQDNLSWQEGLYSNIPWRRGNKIRAGEPLAFFSRVNSAGNNDWANLRFEGIMEHDSRPLSTLDTLFGKQNYIVAINTRIRTITTDIEVISKDNIRGRIELSLDYKVIDVGQLLEFEDPLQTLLDRIGEVVRQTIATQDFQAISSSEINVRVRSANLKRLIGIEILDSRNFAEWPKNITDALGEITTTEMFNTKKIEKLVSFGISDKLLIAAVLSKGDQVYEAVMEMMQAFSDSQRDQYNRELELLQWLSEKDYLSKADVDTIKENLMQKIKNQDSRLPLMGLPQGNFPALAEKMTEKHIEENSGNESLDVKTRTVSFEEKENDNDRQQD